MASALWQPNCGERLVARWRRRAGAGFWLDVVDGCHCCERIRSSSFRVVSIRTFKFIENCF
jgi:hypothetical protein